MAHLLLANGENQLRPRRPFLLKSADDHSSAAHHKAKAHADHRSHLRTRGPSNMTADQSANSGSSDGREEDRLHNAAKRWVRNVLQTLTGEPDSLTGDGA
jgi:hypothetical protein